MKPPQSISGGFVNKRAKLFMKNSSALFAVAVLCCGLNATTLQAQSPPSPITLTDTSRLAWTPSADDSSVSSYRAELFLTSSVQSLPDGSGFVPTGLPALTVEQGKPATNASGEQLGPLLKPSVPSDVMFVAFLRAIGSNGLVSALSNSTMPFTSAVQTGGCNHSITISVQDWTRMVPVGGRGRILLQLANSFPIVQLQIRLGTQAIAEVNGAELRDSAGMYFSVPRTPDVYNISVFAKDSTGCTAQTTVPRTVTVF